MFRICIYYIMLLKLEISRQLKELLRELGLSDYLPSHIRGGHSLTLTP